MSQKASIQRVYNFWSPVYDLAHHLQTLWRDSKYRRLVAQSVGLKPGDNVLDVCAGTGKSGSAALTEESAINLASVDLTYSMLQKAEGKGVNPVNADMERLPFSDNSFDAVISTYGLGGVDNQDKALEEVVRVAKPGARIAAVEMCVPPLERKIKRFVHKHFVGPWIGKFWGFKNTNLESLFERHGIKIKGSEFYGEVVLGSSRLVYGAIEKNGN